MSSTTTFLETSGGRHILNINVQRHKAAKLKREKEKAEFSGLYPPNTTFAASSASLDSDAEAEAAARHFLPAPKSISEMTEEELKEQLALPPGRLTPFTINRIKDKLDVLRGEDKRRREAAIAWEKERRAQIIAREKERQLPDERDTLENLDKQAKEEARERRRLAAAKRAEEARIDAEMKAEFQRANMPRTRKLSDNIPTIVSTGLSKLGIIGKGPTNMPAEMPPMLTGTIRRARLDMQMEASAARREAFLASRPQHARAESAPVPTAKSGGSLLSRFPRPTRSEVSLPLGGSPRKNKMSSSSARPVVPTSPSTTSLTSPLFFKSYRRRAASSTTALASTTVTKETGPRPKIASSPSTMSLSTPTFFRTYRRRAASSSSALVSTTTTATTTATTTNQTTGSQPSSTDTSSQTLPRTTRGLRRARPSIKIVRFNPQSEHTSDVGGTAPLKIVKSNKTKGEEGCEEMPPPLPPKDPWYQPGDKVRRKEGSKSKQGKELESDAWVLVDTAQSESE
ncbi:hypothetical protein CPC08DRAFT_757729 [Agrocybe pediades]|nr:hypothetical protein CPC08DRAFT_757729 [Agrocybe pediades]